MPAAQLHRSPALLQPAPPQEPAKTPSAAMSPCADEDFAMQSQTDSLSDSPNVQVSHSMLVAIDAAIDRAKTRLKSSIRTRTSNCDATSGECVTIKRADP